LSPGHADRRSTEVEDAGRVVHRRRSTGGIGLDGTAWVRVEAVTSEGERALLLWLRELLGNPAMGPVQFVAALGFLGHLPAEDVVKQLSSRMALLEAKVHSLDAALPELVPRIGRLVLIEAEYERAMHHAEIEWIRSLIRDVQRGALAWNPEAFINRPGATS
jgi:hypothetical protein